MDFLSKLDWLMERGGLNRHTLAQQSGIPYTTIVGLYERGPGNARLSTVNKLCKFFGVPLDYLAIDDYERPEDFTPNGNIASTICETSEETELLSLFRNLNMEAQNTILVTVRAFAGNPELYRNPNEESSAMYDHVNRLIKDAQPDGKASEDV